VGSWDASIVARQRLPIALWHFRANRVDAHRRQIGGPQPVDGPHRRCAPNARTPTGSKADRRALLQGVAGEEWRYLPR
jgi:hypothetical protein